MKSLRPARSPFTPVPGVLALVSVGLVLLAGCGDSDAPGENPSKGREPGDGYAEVSTVTYDPLDIPEDAPTVLFLGDSITAGLHLPPDQAFPAAVQRRLMDYGSPFHLVNAGVSGDTTRGGLARLPYLLKNTDAEIVVVELGANDGLRGQSLESTEANLREIIETVRESGARVLLLGMNVPTNLAEYATDFAEMYLEISADLDVEMVPDFLRGVGGLPEMNLADGMHPTPKGHTQLAENMHRSLAAMLSQEPPRIPPMPAGAAPAEAPSGASDGR